MHLSRSVEICIWIQTLSELKITIHLIVSAAQGSKCVRFFPHRWRITAAKEKEWRNKQNINFKTKPSPWVIKKISGCKRRKRCRGRSQTINYLHWNFPLPWNAEVPQGSRSVATRRPQLNCIGKMTNRQLEHNEVHLFSDHVSNLPVSWIFRGINSLFS